MPAEPAELNTSAFPDIEPLVVLDIRDLAPRIIIDGDQLSFRIGDNVSDIVLSHGLTPPGDVAIAGLDRLLEALVIYRDELAYRAGRKDVVTKVPAARRPG